MCRYCSVSTCGCRECEPIRIEGELSKEAASKPDMYVSHIEGRCQACNHKYWMMVANF
jgi:hypothetical protein